MSHYHAVVWMDHHEARLLAFNAEAADETVVHPANSPRHLHHKGGNPSGDNDVEEPSFYRDIAAALGDAKEILVAGPSSAKTEFVKYLAKHMPHLLERVRRIETLDKVTDGQLLAEARRFFVRDDRMQPQRG